MIEQKILDLPLKAKWYLMQESGEKPEEYREITPYWCNRLLEQDSSLGIRYWQEAIKKAYEFDKEGICPLEKLTSNFKLKKYTHVRLRYGYTKRTFDHKIDSITIGYGKPEWGAPKEKKVFIIKHHKESKVWGS